MPGGADWTFYLNTTAAGYATLFGAPPERRVLALPHHVSADARHLVNGRAARLLPPEQAATVQVTAHRMAVPMLDIDPPTQMVWPVGAGHAVLLGDALAPVRPHTAKGANHGIEQAAGLVAALTNTARITPTCPPHWADGNAGTCLPSPRRALSCRGSWFSHHAPTSLPGTPTSRQARRVAEGMPQSSRYAVPIGRVPDANGSR